MVPWVDCQTRACYKPSGQQQASECHQPPVSGLDTGRADAVVPDLRRPLIGGYRLRCAPVVHGRSLEHQCPPSDRSTEDPLPALSPLRTARVAAETPWFTVCAHFMRRAQAGVASAVDEPPPSSAATRRSGLTIAEPPCTRDATQSSGTVSDSPYQSEITRPICTPARPNARDGHLLFCLHLFWSSIPMISVQ
jgi:hypothetical protein